jgi:hypothetical protein
MTRIEGPYLTTHPIKYRDDATIALFGVQAATTAPIGKTPPG